MTRPSVVKDWLIIMPSFNRSPKMDMPYCVGMMLSTSFKYI